MEGHVSSMTHLSEPPKYSIIQLSATRLLSWQYVFALKRMLSEYMSVLTNASVY